MAGRPAATRFVCVFFFPPVVRSKNVTFFPSDSGIPRDWSPPTFPGTVPYYQRPTVYRFYTRRIFQRVTFPFCQTPRTFSLPTIGYISDKFSSRYENGRGKKNEKLVYGTNNDFLFLKRANKNLSIEIPGRCRLTFLMFPNIRVG